MKKKLCFIIGIVIVLLIACCMLFVLSGYFPVIGRYIAESKLSNYTEEKIVAEYDFLKNVYIATDSKGNQLQYNLRANTIYDESYNNDVQIQVNEKYHNFTAKSSFDKIEYPSNLTVWVEINANDTSKEYVKIYLMTIFDSNSIDDIESKIRMCEIINQINECIEVNITSIQFRYANPNGMYDLTCDFGKKSIDQESLDKHIQKIDEKALPLDYIEWKEDK